MNSSLDNTDTPFRSPTSQVDHGQSDQPLSQPSDSTSIGNAPSSSLLWVLRGLCSVALCISGYLAFTAFNSGEVLGCGEGSVFNCDHVLSSKYSKFAGIPVSVPAFALYASLLAVLCFFKPTAPKQFQDLCWKVLTFGGFSAGLAAIWFIGLQFLAIGHLCAYCLVAHTCGLVLAGIVIWKRPLQLRTMSMMSGASLAGIAVLVSGQLMSEAPENFKMERFDDQPANTQVASLDSTSEFGAPVDFGAPVEFGAPDEFAPPVEFESPMEMAPASESVSAEESNLFSPPVTGDVTSQYKTEDVPVLEVPVPGIKEIPTSFDSSTTRDNITRSPTEDIPALRSQLKAVTYLLFAPSSTQVASRLLSHLLMEETSSGESDSDEGEPAGGDGNQVAKKPVVPNKRMVTVSGNRFSLNSRHWPLLGKPDAKYIFVEMFDYTCPHCRQTHTAIDGAFKKYGDDLAVLALPVPLERACNDAASGNGHAGACELAKLSVAVWRVKREKFKEFHDWMFAATRSTSQARAKAEQLVGRDALAAEMKLPHATNYILKHVELYKKVGRGAVPKLMFPQATMTGQASTKTLCSTIENELAQK